MSLYALDAIDDALTATGRYRPRDPFEWVWVVLVAGTVASPGFGLPTGGSSSGEMPAESRAAVEEILPDALPDLFVLVGVAAAALWLLLVVVGAFLEFPFLRWLKSGEFAVRAEVRASWRRALGLAAFRLLINLLLLSVLVGSTVALAGPDADLLTYLFVLVEYWVLFALLGLVTGLVSAFTTAFVVPAMWLEDRSVVDGWRRVWPTLTTAPKEFLAYGVGVAIFATVGGLLVGLAALVAFVPVLLIALSVTSAAGGLAGVVVGGLLGGVSMTVATGLVYAFVQVFLRYYALFVLGDVDPFLDAIPERRRAVRATDGDDGNGDSGGGDGSGDGDGTDDGSSGAIMQTP